jgi:hypothetical protein
MVNHTHQTDDTLAMQAAFRLKAVREAETGRPHKVMRSVQTLAHCTSSGRQFTSTNVRYEVRAR